MEKSKLINICKKFNRSHSNLESPKLIYGKIKKDYPMYFKALSAIDIVIFCFLTPYSNLNEDLNSLYDKIYYNLFTFSLINVHDIEPTDTCDYCVGEGYADCSQCMGDGEEGCHECGGDGDNWGETCNECQGGGNLKCSSCDGMGAYKCTECDGNGYFIKDDTVEVEEQFYISWDKSLFSTIEVMDEKNYEDKLNDILIDNVELNNQSFIIDVKFTNVRGVFDTGKITSGDVFFGSLSKNPSLFFGQNYNIVDSEIDSIG
jgi:hypothetical protein